MTFRRDEQYRLQGWVVSALLHGLTLTAVFGLMAPPNPGVPKEVFKWDVALVEPQVVQATRRTDLKPTREPARPTAPLATPALSQPQMLTKDVPPRKVTPVSDPQPAEVQPAKPAIVESITPTAQSAVVTQPVTTDVPVHQVETRTSETASVRDVPPMDSVAQESAPQLAMATHAAPPVKADYGWLAESLRQRLAAFNRYPSAARLNGWEGKVVLRAVIRADGHLSEVRVHRSSGHEVLDNAAMEAIRLACPLHMTNTMGAAEVAVYVPMVYSLGG